MRYTGTHSLRWGRKIKTVKGRKNRLVQFILNITIIMVLETGFVYAQETVLDITWRGFAQNFKLENFVPDSNGWIQVPYLQKGNIVMEKFPYSEGTYKIKIQVYVDKKGYASTINLFVNEKKVGSLKEDQDTGGSAWYEFEGIKINQGDKLTIEGINHEEELVRLSRLQIIKQEGEFQTVVPSAKQETKAIESTSDNILMNPGFEEGEGSSITGWINQAPNMYKKDETVFYSGKNSLKLSKIDPSLHKFIYQRIPLQPDKRYQITFWAKCENVVAGPEGAGLNCYLESRGGGFYPPGLSGTFNWQKITLPMKKPFKIDPEWSIISLGFFRGAKGTAWIDDVQVEEISEAEVTVGQEITRKGNLVLNENFEEDADNDGVPDNWLPPREGCGSWATDKVISGKHSIKIENNDASVNPLWQQKNIPIKVNQKYLCTINVMAKDFGQEYRFYVEAGPGEGGWWTSSAKWEQTFTSWQKKNLKFTITKPTVTAIYLVFQIKGKGTIWFDDVEIKPVTEEEKEAKESPLEIDLLQPSYRNTIYATQNLETIKIRTKVNVDDIKDKSITVSLKEGEEVIAKRGGSPLTKKEEILEFGAGSLKPGRYVFSAQLKGAGDKVIATVETPLRKVEKASQEVRVREDNILLVNNRPFFPLGICKGSGLAMNDLLLHELHQAGFNLIGFYGPVAKEKSQRNHDMEMADNYNLMVIAGSLGGTYLREQTRSGKEGDIAVIRELVKEDVLNMQGYNNFLGWWIDEPVWGGLPEEPLAEIYRQFYTLDPYHIYWINHAPRNSIEELAAANRFTDISGSDIYPVPEPQYHPSVTPDWTHSDLPNKTLSVVGDETDKLTKTVGGRKPIWMFLQGFGWGPDHKNVNDEMRRPNWEETRFMAYNAIIHGAKGIGYYGVFEYGGRVYKSSDQTLWSDVKRIIKELSRLSPVLVAYSAERKISVSPEGSGIEFITKKCEGALYIIAANTKDKPTTVEFKNLSGTGRMKVLFEENREVEIIGNTFKDHFKGYEVHIYTNAKKLP